MGGRDLQCVRVSAESAWQSNVDHVFTYLAEHEGV